MASEKAPQSHETSDCGACFSLQMAMPHFPEAHAFSPLSTSAFNSRAVGLHLLSHRANPAERKRLRSPQAGCVKN